MMGTPRGIRNNNPGNLDWTSKTTWQGAEGIEPPPPDGSRPRFVKFRSAHFGIRALGKTLWTYVDKHGLRTPAAIANRWAPPSENDTGAYARALAKAVGVGATAEVDWKNEPAKLHALVSAIIRHENGEQPYSDEVIRKALAAAGWEQPAKSIATRVKEAAPIAAAGGGVVTILQEAAPFIPLAQRALDTLAAHPLLAAGVVALVVGGGVVALLLRGGGLGKGS